MQDAPKMERFSNAKFHLHSCSRQSSPSVGQASSCSAQIPVFKESPRLYLQDIIWNRTTSHHRHPPSPCPWTTMVVSLLSPLPLCSPRATQPLVVLLRYSRTVSCQSSAQILLWLSPYMQNKYPHPCQGFSDLAFWPVQAWHLPLAPNPVHAALPAIPHTSQPLPPGLCLPCALPWSSVPRECFIVKTP